MADNDDVSDSPGQDVPQQPVLKTRWRDRAWSFRAILAVTLASLLVGGLAGGAVVAASNGDDDHGHHRMRPWGPGGGPGGFRDGGPRWRWNDGPRPQPGLTPYGVPSPTPPTAAPGTTG